MEEKEKTEKTEAAAKTAKKKKAFSIEALKKNARVLFGTSQAEFAAVTAGLEDKKYTVTEMKSAVEEWRKKEAK